MITERDDEQQQVAAHHRQERQQPLHQRDVGDGAADHLAGVELVLARAVEPVQRAEDFRAQVVLHVQGEPAAHVAPDEAEGEARETGARPAPAPRAAAAGCVLSTAWSTTSRSTSGTPGLHRHPGEGRTEREQHRARDTASNRRRGGAATPRAGAPAEDFVITSQANRRGELLHFRALTRASASLTRSGDNPMPGM